MAATINFSQVEGVATTFSHARVDGGGNVVRNTVARDGTVYCGTDVGSFYKFNPSTNRWVDCAVINRVSYRDNGTRNKGWYQVKEGPGELVVAPSDSNRLYWFVRAGGNPTTKNVMFFRSDDGGATSYELTEFPDPGSTDSTYMRGNGQTPNVRLCYAKIAVDPSNPDVFYTQWASAAAGAGPTGLRSIDGGASFIEINTGDGLPRSNTEGTVFFIDQSSSIVSGAHQRVIAFVAGSGIYESTDAGVSWDQISSTIKTLCPAGFNSGAGRDYYSGSRGQGGFDAAGNFYLHHNLDDTNTWYISRYAGSSWTDILSYTDSMRLAVHPTATGRIAVIKVSDSLYDVTNAHSAVGALSSGLASDLTYTRYTAANMTFTSATPWAQTAATAIKITTGQVTHLNWDVASGKLWCGLFQFIARCTLTPGGTNVAAWEVLVEGIEELVVNDVFHQSGKRLLMGCWDEAGFSWEATPSGLNTPPTWRLFPPQNFEGLSRGWGFGANPHNPNLVWSCGFQAGSGTPPEPFKYSTDGGVTWSDPAAWPASSESAGSIVVGGTAAAPVVLFLAHSASLSPNLPYRSADGGASWAILTEAAFPGTTGTTTGLSTGNVTIRVLCADPIVENVFYLCTSSGSDPNGWGGLWTSTDGGLNWTRTCTKADIGVGLGAKIVKAAPGVSGHLFAAPGHESNASQPTSSQFKRSKNAGVAWEQVNSNFRSVEAFGFGKPKTGSTFPTLFVVGFYAGLYGLYMIDDMTETVNGTPKLLVDSTYGRWPMGLGDTVNCLDGDKDTWGRAYLGTSGHGVIVARVN